MSYNLKNAKLFPWWCNKVLPLVYDDSLSYYEVLCKIMETLKDLIEVEELQNNAITDLDNRATSLEGRMDTAESDIDALEGRMDTAENDIDSLENRMDTAEGDIDSLEGRMNTAEGDIDALEGRMDTAEGDIDSLEGRMNTAEGDIDALEGRMTTAEGDIDNLETRMDTAEGDIDALEGRMDTAENDIVGIKGRLDDAEFDIDGLENRIGAAENDIDDLEADVTPHGFGFNRTIFDDEHTTDGNVGRQNITRELYYRNNLIDTMDERCTIGKYFDYANNTTVNGDYWQTGFIPLDKSRKIYYVTSIAGTDNKPIQIDCFEDYFEGGSTGIVGNGYGDTRYLGTITASELTEYKSSLSSSSIKCWKVTLPNNCDAVRIAFDAEMIPITTHDGTAYPIGTNSGYFGIAPITLSMFASNPYAFRNFEEAYCLLMSFPVFNYTFTYSKGSVVRKGWLLYRAKRDLAANTPMDTSNLSTDWERVTVADLVDRLEETERQLNGVFDNSINHRNIYRGIDLTTKYTIDEIYRRVHDGSFDDLYLGDYIPCNNMSCDMYTIFTGSTFVIGTIYYERSGVHPDWAYSATSDLSPQTGKTYYTKETLTLCCNMMIADFDYYIGRTADELNQHHIVLVPQTTIFKGTEYGASNMQLFYAPMNTSASTSGGYFNSEMHQTTLPCIANSFKDALNNHIMLWQDTLSTAMDANATAVSGGGNIGAASSNATSWINIRLMSEAMIMGTISRASSYYDHARDARQLSVFRYKTINAVDIIGENFRISQNYWLSVIANSTKFCVGSVNSIAQGTANNTTNKIAIRPIILFG